MVPREWISPPDHETAEGELLDEAEEEDDEHAAMLESDRRRRRREQHASTSTASGESIGESLAGGPRLERDKTPPPRLVSVKDTSGRDMPVAERAPLPKRLSAST